MISKTCIVQLGRYGDVINILAPARDIALKEGGKCAVLVSAEFASVLEGCSYIEPVVISSHFTDVQPAIAHAQALFPRVLVGKTNEKNVGVTTQCEAFNQESWRQLGYLDKWDVLPLVFDRRDREREGKLIADCGLMIADFGSGKPKPIVLVNFSGKSAPFERGDTFKRLFRPDLFQVLDLAGVRAHRIYDLIGLMDSATLLVTGDTSTLHLAAASGVPVVNLIGDKPTRWHGSKPRNNSVMDLRYSEQVGEISALTRQDAGGTWRRRVWHVWSDYPMDGETLRRHELAKRTWPESWIPFPVVCAERRINDPMRSLPFVKDMLAEVVRAAGPRDLIVLTNSDTCVSPGAEAEIAGVLPVYSFRRDFSELRAPKSMQEIRNAPQYAGADLFAFPVEWWTKHGRTFPDMVLGAECWDWCLRVLLNKTGALEFNDLCYHERHANVWEVPEHRNTLPSQLHNKRLAAPFLAAHGVK